MSDPDGTKLILHVVILGLAEIVGFGPKLHGIRNKKTDVFAHLETQFKFFNLSDLLEGVLGKPICLDTLVWLRLES